MKWFKRRQPRDSQLNVYNYKKLRMERPDDFYYVRFDPNNNCNVHCVYCHNHRNKDLVPAEELDAFLRNNVSRLRNFQMGCIMEPTLDKRMADLMLLVANSPKPPENQIILQTNGILLHMHDTAKIHDSRVNRLSVSSDAADPDIHRALRGGTSIAKVANNIKKFMVACPDVQLIFITTVTQINLPAIEHLVRSAWTSA